MHKQTKQSLKLPIFLIIGPILGVITSVVLYAIINFISASSSGASSTFITTSNLLLTLLGSVSMLAFLPCLIFGIIILNKRRSARAIDTAVAGHKESRGWSDLE